MDLFSAFESPSSGTSLSPSFALTGPDSSVAGSPRSSVPSGKGYREHLGERAMTDQYSHNRHFHFHLTSDEDLDLLRAAVQTGVCRTQELVGTWWNAYVDRFGNSRTLSEQEFKDLLGATLNRGHEALLERDIDRYRREVERAGDLLAGRGMRLEEMIAALQLLNESMRRTLAGNPLMNPDVEAALDRISHLRAMLFVSGYFRSLSAVAGTRAAALAREAAILPMSARNRFHGLVGASPGMKLLYERIEMAAASSGNLLIVGESGTGKELVARAIHESGPRKGKPFVALNCAALPKDLIESELFGYKKGAFSGANNDHLGLFRAADGGTLFLDEITEMDASTQTKLLRAIQERAIRPVGTTQEQPVNVRLIASTNRDPKAAVANGNLREDLYYRLQASVLTIPALRDRREDIPLLVDHFIAVFAERFGREVAGIEQRALEAICNYSWPGNVRELSNTIEAAFTFGRGSLIEFGDLPSSVTSAIEQDAPAVRGEPSGCPRPGKPVPSFAEAERDLIEKALLTTNGNKVAAAELLGISRKKLYAKIEKYHLASLPN